jgi:hypothetical protein
VARLIDDLNSDRFAARDQAMQQLSKLGAVVESALTAALAKNPPLEAQQRLQRLLAKLQAPNTTPRALQEARAVELLEHLGTPKPESCSTSSPAAPPTPR